MKYYHKIRLGNGSVIYCPTSIKDNVIEFAPTDHLISESHMKIIKVKETILSLKEPK
jgi:hypothetical protein